MRVFLVSFLALGEREREIDTKIFYKIKRTCIENVWNFTNDANIRLCDCDMKDVAASEFSRRITLRGGFPAVAPNRPAPSILTLRPFTSGDIKYVTAHVFAVAVEASQHICDESVRKLDKPPSTRRG